MRSVKITIETFIETDMRTSLTRTGKISILCQILCKYCIDNPKYKTFVEKKFNWWVRSFLESAIITEMTLMYS